MFMAGRSEAENNVLRIGSLNPLIIKEGLEQKKWHDLFTKIVNEQGGVKVGGKAYKVEFYHLRRRPSRIPPRRWRPSRRPSIRTR